MDVHSSDCTHLHGTTASYVPGFVFSGCFIRCLKVCLYANMLVANAGHMGLYKQMAQGFQERRKNVIFSYDNTVNVKCKSLPSMEQHFCMSKSRMHLQTSYQMERDGLWDCTDYKQ